MSHGARTYRTYERTDFFTSTTRPHKYVLDKYGRHDGRDFFFMGIMAAVLIVLMKTHFLSSTASPHKYDLDKYERHAWLSKSQHGGRTYRTYERSTF